MGGRKGEYVAGVSRGKRFKINVVDEWATLLTRCACAVLPPVYCAQTHAQQQ